MIRQPKLPPAWWKITAIEQGRSFTWISIGPGILVAAHHRVEQKGNESQATLSLDVQGVLGGVFGRMTRNITERYLDFEAKGLKGRSEDPSFRHRKATQEH